MRQYLELIKQKQSIEEIAEELRSFLFELI